jgi:hypothetical protein
MNVQRVAAILNTSLGSPGSGDRARLPAPGDTFLLTLDELRGDGVLATTQTGLSMRLSGLEALNRNLRPGDTLSVRVLANEPTLELQIYNPQAHADTAHAVQFSLNDFPAMRLDLAELRSMAWVAPNAVALAATWQRQALDRAVFPVYVWCSEQRCGMQLSLRLVDADEEQPRAAPRRRRRAVQIELSHPSLGRILVEVSWYRGGMELTLGVETAAAQAARAALPAVVAALSRANLRLMRVRLRSAQGRAAPPLEPPQASRTPDYGQAPDPRLFRAAAEIAVTLLNLTTPRC